MIGLGIVLLLIGLCFLILRATFSFVYNDIIYRVCGFLLMVAGFCFLLSTQNELSAPVIRISLIVGGVLVILICVLLVVLDIRKQNAYEKRTAEEAADKVDRNLSGKIYSECKKREISDFSSPENEYALKIIANNFGVTDIEKAKEYYQKGKSQAETSKKQNEEYSLSSAKTSELNEYNEQYEKTAIVGRNKYLGKRIQSAGSSSSSLKDVAMQAMNYRAPQQDWAIAGGLASGIAGPAAGIATALNVQAANAAAEAEAAQIRQLGAQLYAASLSSSNRSHMDEKQLKAYENERHVRNAICDDTEPEQKLKSLSFSDWQFQILKTGNIAVKGNCSLKEKIELLSAPAVLDGSIKLEIKDKHKKTIAEGFYNAPGFDEIDLQRVGFQNAKEIKATCISVIDEGKEMPPVNELSCVVSPVHLWTIELKKNK